MCGERYKVGLAQAVFFAGCVVGAGVFGHLSGLVPGPEARPPHRAVAQALGLRTPRCACSPTSAPAASARTYPRLLPRHQSMSTFYFFSGGIAALAGVAALFPHSWRLLYVVTSLPSIAFVVAVMPFVSESPRWYLVRRRVHDAMRVIRAIAAANGRHVPDDVTLKLDNEDEEEAAGKNGGGDESPAAASASGSIVDVFRSRTTRVRLVLSVFINLLTSVVYYGLTLNVVNLKTNLYVSVVVNSIAEMPAYLLTALLLDHLGRKPLAIGTMLLSGIFCTAGSLIPGAGVMRVVRMVCGMVGIFGVAATYNLLFIYTAELFPTSVRNAAMGCATQAAQMGAIVAPLVVVLGERVPFAVFGACGIIGALLVVYLPETMNKPLYDTMAGMEEGEKSLLK